MATPINRITTLCAMHTLSLRPRLALGIHGCARLQHRARMLLRSMAPMLALCGALAGCGMQRMQYTKQDEDRVSALGLPLILQLDYATSASGNLSTVYLSVVNIGSDPIKYLEFDFRWYNRVNDEVTRPCKNCGKPHALVYRMTGPFEAHTSTPFSYGEGVREEWDALDVTCVELTRVTIVRFNDTKVHFGQQEIDAMLVPGPQKRCVAGTN